MSGSSKEGEGANSLENEQDRSLELAKVGFDHSQRCVTFLDAKVGAAMGLILLLLPAPLAILAWLTRIQGDFEHRLLQSCHSNYISLWVIGLLLFSGWLCAANALYWGIRCLTPRGSKGHDRLGPFQNHWNPNVLFPMYNESDPTQALRASEHFRQLQKGSTRQFAITEYQHQLEQMGRILDAKVSAMKQCFRFLSYSLAVNGVGLVFGSMLLLTVIFGK